MQKYYSLWYTLYIKYFHCSSLLLLLLLFSPPPQGMPRSFLMKSTADFR